MFRYNQRMLIYSDKYFENPIDIIKAFDNRSFYNALKRIEEYRKNYFLAGYIKYEAYKIFLNQKINEKLPVLYFEVYENYKKYNPKQNNNYFINIEETISKAEYNKNIKKIKDRIKNGITYEVNYTYPSKIYSDCSDYELYKNLLSEQKTPYNAYIENEYESILSFSPELFFKTEKGHITTKPMKGTIKRGLTEEEDKKNIELLRNDIKNQSENIMIVDLIRNDLAKIAKPGSVKTDKLFEIEKHKTLFQMTSEISAELRNDVDLYNILEALFPCGSVTGAPKISTIKVINETENYKREVYCGAIGIISPDYCEFSVPIRILQRKKNDLYFKYAAGGAIVWDSEENDEYNETIVKRAFLNKTDNFQLIETMKSENGKIFLFNEHINRLKNSCRFFNFKFPEELETLIPQQDGIIRVIVYKDGKYETEYKKLSQQKTNIITISNKTVYSKNILLYHKTTKREIFKESAEKIKNNEVFDEIYLNEKGEVTEGSRSNVVIKKDNKLYTPTIDSGLLNGTLRTHLLNKGIIQEQKLYLKDLKNADAIYCINSIRGMTEVELTW